MGLVIQEKKFKIDFQDGNCGGHLVSPIGTILAIFALQVISTILTKFQANWPFGSGEEAKNRFPRWPQRHGGHLGFPIGTILAIFDLPVTSLLPTKFLVNWSFGSEEEAKNRFSRWPPWRLSYISHRNNFSYFLSNPKASYAGSRQLAFRFRRRSEK